MVVSLKSSTSPLAAVRAALLAGLFVGSFVCGGFGPLANAQTRPIVGIRAVGPSPVALVDAHVVTHPGAEPRPMTVLIENRQIRAVGESIAIPPGAETISLSGKTIYAGFIDSYRGVETPYEHDSNNGFWNANVTPRRTTESVLNEIDGMKAARGQGITAVVAAPTHRIMQGRSVVIIARDPGDGDSGDRVSGDSDRLLAGPSWQHLQLTVPRQRTDGETYPRSPMGAVALLRQTFYDSIWYRDAWAAHRAKPQLTRPATDLDLASLGESLGQGTFVIDAPNERMAIRAVEMADEFSLNVIIKGSGREYRALDEIAIQKRALILPLDFPKPPNVDTQSAADEAELRTLQHWHFAPRNAAMLHDAGVEFAFTAEGLEKPEQFLEHVRRCVEVGLPADAALAALTTTPARLLGLSDQIGTIDAGKLASLVILDNEWSQTKAKVTETWVAGKRYEIVPTDESEDDGLIGTWTAKTKIEKTAVELLLEIKASKGKYTAEIRNPKGDDDSDESDAKKKKDEEKKDDEKADSKVASAPSTTLREPLRQRHSFSALIDLSALSETVGESLDKVLGEELGTGVGSLSIPTPRSSSPEMSKLSATVTMPNGQSYPVILTKLEAKQPAEKDESATDDESSDEDDESPIKDDESLEKDEKSDDKDSSPEFVITFPLGGHGRTSLPAQPATVLFRGASVWTCDGQPHRVADVLVTAGKITGIADKIAAPAGCRIVDASGKHLTPGLIDCHSHIATDGGINESGQDVTAEVRIGDFVDPTDVTIYRQLAGGVTSANLMHGSANPIGGQNQVIKMRWGGSMNELRFRNAPLGIKFALGENVKRLSSRYPNTRMGVEQLIRDRFLAARQYDAEHRAYAAGNRDRLPPRRDLELEAIAEIQSGKRWIHCHSYRQDEIIATLDVLEEFGVQIGTLQHILEGYKVADRIAAHGAMASSFADWWAYKFEVFDAIPYNGVLMHDAGVVVSYNSDDPELGRHLNTEAAKAVKYGGVDPEEALQFVTLNPARQLRIEDRVGSIEIGKDADLVLWSGPPLSTLSRCEQTWIDGRCYFSLDDDQKLRQRDAQTRIDLVQMLRKLDAPKPKPKKAESDADPDSEPEKELTPEEARWLRYDEYCTMKGGAS